jgi:hypothetical protein
MNDLSREARAALENGLKLDGPSGERRAHVKSRLLVAFGSGAAVLGGSAAAAEAATPLVAGVAATAKGLAMGSLLVWFGAGALAGAGMSGAVVAVRHVTTPAGQATRGRPLETRRAAPEPRAALKPAVSAASVVAAPDEVGESAPRADRAANAGALSAAPAGVGNSPVVNTPPAPSAPPVASSSTLSEEAALLERAERALVRNEPNTALAALAEHERRFPLGALREERQAAKVLAFCTLGWVAEARTLARAFVSTAPGSVLVPRLERSCVGPVLKAR